MLYLLTCCTDCNSLLQVNNKHFTFHYSNADNIKLCTGTESVRHGQYLNVLELYL